MKKKFYVIVLKEKNGEYSYSHMFLAELNPRASVYKHAEKIARTFYDGKCIEDSGYYLFHSDAIAVGVQGVVEVSKSEFDVLKQFLSIL